MALAFEWSVGMQSMCSSPDNAIAGCRIARGHCRESHGGRCREMHGGHGQPAFRGRCETFRRPSIEEGDDDEQQSGRRIENRRVISLRLFGGSADGMTSIRSFSKANLESSSRHVKVVQQTSHMHHCYHHHHPPAPPHHHHHAVYL